MEWRIAEGWSNRMQINMLCVNFPFLFQHFLFVHYPFSAIQLFLRCVNSVSYLYLEND